MSVSRRRFLAGAAAAATAGLTGCGSRSSLGGPGELSMWTWVGSVNDDLIKQATGGIPGEPAKKLAMTRIGSNSKTKVLTALAGKSLVPDILAINDDVATYFPNADQFHDLRELGAEQLAGQYLDWKWKLGITPHGAGFFRQYLTVGLPVLRPGLAFLGIFTFINVWNDYLFPLVVMTDPNKLTLQVALQQLNGIYGMDYSMVMAGALMSVVLLVGAFLIGGRHFIADLAAGAMKF